MTFAIASATKRRFLNCPFDNPYHPIFQAMLFAVYDFGFLARSALGIDDAREVRLEKILRIIGECAYSIHDISAVKKLG